MIDENVWLVMNLCQIQFYDSIKIWYNSRFYESYVFDTLKNEMFSLFLYRCINISSTNAVKQKMTRGV